MIVLPTEKISPVRTNPKFLIVFGKPKCGKTTITANLEKNLIIEMEPTGADFLNAMYVNVNSITELYEVYQAIRDKNTEANKPIYDYITLDYATKLQDMVMPLALQLYQKTPMGKTYTGDILALPNGAGHQYVRTAFMKVINMFKSLAPTLILICQTKDNQITKQGTEVTELSIDLMGQLARLVAADADAVAYCYRDKNKTYLNFNGGTDYLVEARPPHLRGREIVIAESDEINNLTFHWDEIFLKN